MLVNTSAEKAWQVLTNYNNLAEFIPDIVSSQIVANNNTEKILAQVYSAPYTFGQKINVRVAIKEISPYSFEFRLIQGDYLNVLQGNWKIEPVADGNPNQVWVTQEITVDPQIGFGKSIFYELYQQSIEENMTMLKQKMESL